VRAVPGHETRQRVPAGDQREAGRTGGQQRAYLLDAVGVVQQDEHPAPVEEGAEAGGALVEVFKDRRAVQAERTQEAGQRVGGRHRLVGAVPAQVRVQPAVREPVAHPVRPAHGERRLAHPDGTGHRRDRHRRLGAEQPVQLRELRLPADEAAHVHRELGGHVPARDLGRRRGQVVGEDAAVQLAQLRPRFEAELGHQRVPCPAVDLQRLRPAASPVQRGRQQPVQPFPPGVLPHQVGEFADDRLVQTAGELGLVQRLDGGEAVLGEA
jgi:hypothetical protein